MHALLRRQLDRLGLAADRLPQDAAAWGRVLAAVERAYADADRDRYLLGRALEVTDRELQEHAHQVASDGARRTEAERARFLSLEDAMLFVAGTDGWLRAASPALVRLLGWPRETLLASSWLAFVHPADHAASVLLWARIAAGCAEPTFRCRWRTADGRWVGLQGCLAAYPSEGLVYGSLRALPDAEGEPPAPHEPLRLTEGAHRRA